MTHPPDPPPDRRSKFEWSLAALRPADAEVARPSFMFKAGQASRDKVVRFWRLVAGGLAVLIVVGGVAGFGLVQSEQQRATAVTLDAQAARVQLLPPRAIPAPAEDEVAPHLSTEFLVPAPPTSPRTRPSAPDRPSASEIASALERRRNILVGGLGLIPDALPTPAPESRPGNPAYPGVLAAPRVQKKPTLLDPDPDPIPDDQ
jgi:hypothetical protein